MIAFIFDEQHTFADIYQTFDKILSMGVKNLYTDTKDLVQLKDEMSQMEKNNLETHSLFEWKVKQHEEEKKMRTKLELAYE
jgi:hypothetical protein